MATFSLMKMADGFTYDQGLIKRQTAAPSAWSWPARLSKRLCSWSLPGQPLPSSCPWPAGIPIPALWWRWCSGCWLAGRAAQRPAIPEQEIHSQHDLGIKSASIVKSFASSSEGPCMTKEQQEVQRGCSVLILLVYIISTKVHSPHLSSEAKYFSKRLFSFSWVCFTALGTAFPAKEADDRWCRCRWSLSSQSQWWQSRFPGFPLSLSSALDLGDRREICQTYYTTRSSGQKFYTPKVRKLRLF